MKNNFEIKNLTTFKIGGLIKRVFLPDSVEEFVENLKFCPKVLGNMSNVLISSFGYDGDVVLTKHLSDVKIMDNLVEAQAGILGIKLAQEVMQKGLSGLEFMIGFPGTLGGNVSMNASANGQCVSDKLKNVKCFDGEKILTLSKEEMKFSYRHSICEDNKNLVVLSAEFELDRKNPDLIKQTMDECLQFRRTHQPSLALANCGSVFKNPINNSAGKLLDEVGAKEMKVGGAKVWDNHANFIINTGSATSTDVLELMLMMSSAVENKFGIKLIPEVRYLGSNQYEESLCEKLRMQSV